MVDPTQPQPRGEGDDLAARLESEVIGYSISLGLTESQCDLLHAAASRLRTSTEGEAQDAFLDETQVERMQHAIYDALRIGEPVGPTTRAILQGQLTDEQRANLEPAPTDQGERDGLAQSLELLAVAMGHGLPYRCEPKVALDNAALLREAASALDHQTKALEAADELARVVSARVAPPPESSQLLGLTAARDLYRAHDAYRSTRTSTEGEAQDAFLDERLMIAADDSGPEATGSVATPERSEGLRLAEDASRGPDRPASPSTEGGARVEKPRMALRPYHDDPERLDDVVVEDVAMFRAEMMDDGHLWMACYFDKNGTDLHFSVMAGKTGRAQLHLSATDVPPHIDIDADEPAQSDTPTDQEDA